MVFCLAFTLSAPLFLGAAVAPAAGAPAPGPAVAGKAAGERELILFYTSSIEGALEPCGCTSDPLGDIARYAELVRRVRADAARAGAPVLLVDAGNLSYPAAGVPERSRPAARLRAAFLARTLPELGLAAAALGPSDLVDGPARVVPPRLAANVSGAGKAVAGGARLVTAGSGSGALRVGFVGVSAELPGGNVTTSDPVEAATQQTQALRTQGADVVVVLAAMDRAAARRVARRAQPDVVVVGQAGSEGLTRAEVVEGKTVLVGAADELQRVGRLDLTVRAPAAEGPRWAEAGGAEARAQDGERLDRQIASLEADLARWSAGAGTEVDPAFVASRRAERDELRRQRAALDTANAPPPEGSYFRNRLIPLRRVIPRNAAVAAGLRALDREVGRVNLAAAEAPPKAEPGRAAYVGDRACARCHKTAQAFWTRTVHAQAWKTLVQVGKQADLECVGCHMTGYGEVGGGALGFSRGLEAVQCETCHGPGSLHVAAEGLDEPPTVHRETPQSTCVRCHTEKHSDTFAYDAYLRDVLGTGHGQAARAKLGDGPTGGQLRRTALARSAAAGKAQAAAFFQDLAKK